jgi:TonB family protein
MSIVVLDRALGALWIDVLRHLWQSALVVLPLFFVARVLRTAPARWSHRLWVAALVKLFVPLAVFGPWAGAALRRLAEARGAAPAGGGLPGFQVLVSVIGADGNSASSSLAERFPAPFWIACTAIYAVIACALLVRTGRDLASARRLAARPMRVSGRRAVRLAGALAQAGLHADRVVISGANLIPAVVGTVRPRIVVPARLLDELEVDELAAVLLHEDMHRRHADPAIALIQRITTSLLFFFPLLAPLQRRIREAAELRCDEGALRAGAEASAYARALARTVQLGLDPSPAPAALDDGNPSLVARRIDRLQEPGRTRIMMKHRLAMGFAVALLAAGVLLPVTPHGLMAGTGANTAEFKRVWNLDKRVTIKFEKTPAVKVIDAIAAASGVEITTEGPTNCCLVSVAVADAPAGQALESVAKQSGIRFEVVDSKRLRAVFPGAINADVKMPEITHRVHADYPKDAMNARAEGFVVLTATVGADGTVGDVEVVRHADGWPSMDQAAVKAVRQFSYKPAMKDGEPVAVQLHVRMEFSLRKGSDDASARFPDR